MTGDQVSLAKSPQHKLTAQYYTALKWAVMKAGMEPERNEVGWMLTNIQPQVYTFNTTFILSNCLKGYTERQVACAR